MNHFIARQPIFDSKKDVFAYEILLAPAADDGAVPPPGHMAAPSDRLFEAVNSVGLDTLSGGRKTFVTATRDLLGGGGSMLLPAQSTVIDLLPSFEADEAAIRACRMLKREGYEISLSDFCPPDPRESLLDLADYLRVDFLSTSDDARRARARDFGRRGIRMLAEGVETPQLFEEARRHGYEYLQGRFFQKPRVQARDELAATRMGLLGVIKEIQHPDLDYERIEQIIKRDVSLAYRFLRFSNSAFFGWKTHISSIRHALALLGENEIRKWVTLVAMTSLAEQKPRELLVQAGIRARMLECLASEMGMSERSQDFFLLGMFSLIDAALDRPMAEVLADLPIAPDVKEALLGRENPMRRALVFVESYERGEWEEAAGRATTIGLDWSRTPALYREALRWGRQALE